MLSVCPSLITAFPAALSERPREIVRVPAIDAARKQLVQRRSLLLYERRPRACVRVKTRASPNFGHKVGLTSPAPAFPHGGRSGLFFNSAFARTPAFSSLLSLHPGAVASALCLLYIHPAKIPVDKLITVRGLG